MGLLDYFELDTVLPGCCSRSWFGVALVHIGLVRPRSQSPLVTTWQVLPPAPGQPIGSYDDQRYQVAERIDCNVNLTDFSLLGEV